MAGSPNPAPVSHFGSEWSASPWTKVGICLPPGPLSSLRPHGPQERGQAPDRCPSPGAAEALEWGVWQVRGRLCLGPGEAAGSSVAPGCGPLPPGLTPAQAELPPRDSTPPSRVSPSERLCLRKTHQLRCTRLVPSPRARPFPPLLSVRPSSALWCRPTGPLCSAQARSVPRHRGPGTKGRA